MPISLDLTHIQLSGSASANLTVGNPSPSSLTLTNNPTTISFPISSTVPLDTGTILQSNFNYTFTDAIHGNVITLDI